MGAYKAAIVTEGGQNLIAQALADNKTLMFTSAKTSSYAYPSGTNIAALTGLRDIVQSVIPSRSQVLNDNVAQVTARFDNDGITQQYLIQTIGLYAQIENDPEILFSIAQAITPDEMPVHSNVSPSAFVYNIHHTVQNAAQIIITVNPAGTATVADIWSIEDPEFDDSGIVEGITSFPDLLDKIRSKMNIFQFYRDLKAGLRFVLHAGQLVNNCTSEATDLPLAAAQGKALWDKITAAVTALTTHKSSGDHDGRYYTESEINNLLAAKVSKSDLVNNATSAATDKAPTANQVKVLNDRINALNGDLSSRGRTYWSGPENLWIAANTWASGARSIKIPAGNYVISAHARLPAGDYRAYINITETDFAEQYATIPSSVDVRRATVTFVAFFERETTIRVRLFSATGVTAEYCEVSAIRVG